MDKLSINLTLTVEQVNVIFAALGKMPFDSVFELIRAIKLQADEQYEKAVADKGVDTETPPLADGDVEQTS